MLLNVICIDTCTLLIDALKCSQTFEKEENKSTHD